jgi:hypothetical protein
VSAHDENYDEEYEKPIVNATDVTESIERLAPIITFKIDGMERYGAAHYSQKEGFLFAIAIWDTDRWVTLDSFTGPDPPLVLVALPTLRGTSDVKFVCENQDVDRAYRVA